MGSKFQREMLLDITSLIAELLHSCCVMPDKFIQHFRACFFPYVSWGLVVFTL